ncbi:MAG: Transcriptional regulatory protein LiaR [Chloroflexi bacterium ADurb.Bin325]|nr:MAG: Transcriptional regulatory protein LiaR [Chloroflexi bacterium ADurb.Bin325]
MIRLLIVDDHAVVRQGLRIFLGLDPDLEIVAEAADGAEAVALARQHSPDVVLMDLLMPVMSGVEATAIIRRELPDTEVLALTSVVEDAAVIEALRAGAIGYLLKNTDAPELRRAVKAAASGQVQLSPQMTARLAAELRTLHAAERLTEREWDVLRLLARGQSNKEIGQTLQISETTAKTHVKNVLGKLGVPGRTQAALYAAQMGLAPLAGLEPDGDG